MRAVGMFSVVAALGLLAGCNQQAEADLATCRIELTKSQAEFSTAKTSQSAAEQKVKDLEGQLTQSTEQLAMLQKSADEAAQKQAEAQATTGKAKATKTAQAKTEKAELKEAAQKADVQVMQPPSTMTVEQKGKAAGF
jgi:chromosome segregation ATPase